MMRLSRLAEQDPLWIMLSPPGAMMLAAELGYRGRPLVASGVWRMRPATTIARDPQLDARALALLLAFSFGASAAQRYDARRQLVIEDAIPLRALYSRSTLLAQPQRGAVPRFAAAMMWTYAPDSGLLHRDVDSPPTSTRPRRSPSRSSARSWDLVRTLAQHQPPAQGADDMLKLLIDASSVNSKRVQAYISHVPDPIIWLLLGTAVGSLATVGYSGGLAGHRGIVARVLFSLVVCGTTFIILELDRPARGVLRVDQGPMIQLRQLIDQDSGAST